MASNHCFLDTARNVTVSYPQVQLIQMRLKREQNKQVFTTACHCYNNGNKAITLVKHFCHHCIYSFTILVPSIDCSPSLNNQIMDMFVRVLMTALVIYLSSWNRVHVSADGRICYSKSSCDASQSCVSINLCYFTIDTMPCHCDSS